MSILTTINAGDNISTSRTDINTNFSNLNADKVETTVLDTDTTLAANSDLKVATQKAVKAYVDSGGNTNASTTVRGVVEEATSGEVAAGTGTGATGARLFINPSSMPAIFNGFGSGADGDLNVASGTTTMAANRYYSSVTVSAGAVLDTAGYSLYCKTSINNAGTIRNNGNDGATGQGGSSIGAGTGVGGAGGAAKTLNTFGVGSAGGAGGNGRGPSGSPAATAGTNGGAVNPSLPAVSGGAGGISAVAAGAGGVATTETLNFPATFSAITGVTSGGVTNVSALLRVLGSTSIAVLSAGAGGGGGGGAESNGTNQGAGSGGGGGGGGVIVIASPTIINSGTIQVNAGNGGQGGSADPARGDRGSGGGGGSGGVIVLIYQTLTDTGTIQALAGTAGAVGAAGAVGNSNAGVAGNAGRIYRLLVGNNLIA